MPQRKKKSPSPGTKALTTRAAAGLPNRAEGAVLLRGIGFTAAEVRVLSSQGQLQELAAIVSLARQAFGDDAAGWFRRPESALGSVLPATLMRDPVNGPNLVKQVILNSLRGTIA